MIDQKNSEFNKKYNSLNLAQKKAVDTIDGPVMVIAGPGTGKTTILTLRIANILLKTDIEPESILALTFTDSGVVSMRNKLADIIGPTAYQIKITTFHGFTNELISNNPDIFPEFVSFESATETDQLYIIQEILKDKKFNDLRPLGDPNKYVSSIKNIISNLKRENIAPLDYKNTILKNKSELENDSDNYNKKTGQLKVACRDAIKKLDKSLFVADIYDEYQKNLQLSKIYDYDDMILCVLQVFKKNKDFLLEQQEQFQYILADEHQDANGSQNKILEYLSNFHDSPNLFIVGDEKQAIFRFQGASLENFLFFKKKYPSTEIIELTENYRSSQSILDTAYDLIDKNFSPDRKKENIYLKSGALKSENKIQIVECLDENSENYLIAKEIEFLIENGENPNEIAVIYRKNREAYDLAKLFEKLNIPFFIKSNQDILYQEDVNKIRQFTIAILDLTNNENLAKILAFDYFKNNPIDLHKIFNHIRQNQILLIDVISDLELLKEIGVKDIERFIKLNNLLLEFSEKALNISAVKFFEDILYETDFMKNILQSSSSLERLSAIDKLFSELKTKSVNNKNYRIKDFMDYLSLIESYNTGLKAGLAPIEKGVSMMTAHGSKGLEFKFVFVPHATSKIWNSTRNIQHFYFPDKKLEKESILEDERRLFYVAITRAKEKVFIYYSKFNLDGKENSPSQFLYEIKDELKDLKEHKQSEIKSSYTLISKESKLPSLHDAEYVKNLFLDRSLSVSALNNYLKCPWKYFYQNLLRLPSDQSDEQKNGDAFHYALKNFYKEYDLTNIKPDFEKFFKYYNDFIWRTNLDEIKRERYIERAERDLKIYYDSVLEKTQTKILVEYSIGDIEIKLNSGDILKIYGTLDRIDFMPDGQIVVVDYKTTLPKSMNEIMGKTQDSNGDYYRQLVFYKMLIDEHHKQDWTLNSAKIIFMKIPEDKDEIKELEFQISDQEVLNLKEEIGNFAEDIINLNFWDKKCDDKECVFCKFGRPN
jgi:DNA helicase II / ATP-dependent DNA helicase PcrA